MSKCQRCGMRTRNHKNRLDLVINDDPNGYQCIYCYSYHNWATGKLLKEVKKDSKKN